MPENLNASLNHYQLLKRYAIKKYNAKAWGNRAYNIANCLNPTVKRKWRYCYFNFSKICYRETDFFPLCIFAINKYAKKDLS